MRFYGLAYGDTNVSLTATINGSTVFSGEIPTIATPMLIPPDFQDQVVLFSIENSTLFPSNWEGSYPMVITVTGGYGAIFNSILSNYMPTHENGMQAVIENSSINGTTLNVGTVNSGTLAVGQILTGDGILDPTWIVDGSGTTWTINKSQLISNTIINAQSVRSIPGTADNYVDLFMGIPDNSEGSRDPRSNVTIDGITQAHVSTLSSGQLPRVVPTGSTISYNLNVSIGLCAQS